jgi:hypothetical protein
MGNIKKVLCIFCKLCKGDSKRTRPIRILLCLSSRKAFINTEEHLLEFNFEEDGFYFNLLSLIAEKENKMNGSGWKKHSIHFLEVVC